jgi:hypothetical protein
VVRAVDLLMGRVDKTDLLKSSTPTSTPIRAFDKAPFSAPKPVLIKVTSPFSALEPALQKYGGVDQQLDRRGAAAEASALQKQSPPLALEASSQEAADVDALLAAVAGTDRGVACDPARRLAVEQLIARLEARAVGRDALQSEWLYQRGEVGGSSSWGRYSRCKLKACGH